MSRSRLLCIAGKSRALIGPAMVGLLPSFASALGRLLHACESHGDTNKSPRFSLNTNNRSLPRAERFTLAKALNTVAGDHSPDSRNVEISSRIGRLVLGLIGFVTLFSLFFAIEMAFAEEGSFSVLFYENGRPMVSKQITVNGAEKLVTNKLGIATGTLESGEHFLEFLRENENTKVPFYIAPGDDTQVIVNLVGDRADVETIAPEKSESSVEIDPEKVGVVEGQVINFADAKPVAGATVFVKGTNARAVTGASGKFQLDLPEGDYTLSVLHSKYTTEIVRDIKVSAKGTTSQKVSMTPAGLELQDFVVLAPRMAGSIEALIEVRKSSSNVADVLSAEQISKSGDSDAASSLRRVTGLTLVDGKFVYVRGLGERYSNTLLNGVALPSPDPSRRVVPLDLFPVGVLESLMIQKSYSPDRTGEFGGGSILLKTKSFPKKRFFKASLSTEFSSNNSGFRTYQGGGSDYLGVDDGTRALPAGLSLDRPSTGAPLQSFKNIHNTEAGNTAPLPGFSLSFGNGHKLRKFRLSYVGSLMYGDKYSTREETKTLFSLNKGELQEVTTYEKDRFQRTIKTGGLVGFGVGYGKRHQLNTNFLLVRRTTDETAFEEGVSEESADEYDRDTQLEWTERQLQSLMFDGEHTLVRNAGIKLKWRSAHSEAQLYQPDSRIYRYKDSGNGLEFFSFDKTSGYQRRFSQLDESAVDNGASLHFPLPLKLAQKKAELSFGVGEMKKDRESAVRRYSLRYGGADPSTYGVNRTDDLENILRDCFNTDCFQYQDDTRATDNYQANQTVNAYYTNLKLPLGNKLEVQTGVRLEESEQEVSSFALFTAEAEPIVSRLNTRDVLPGHSLTWKMTEKMQVRAAYSETVSRPDFKELSNTLWKDDERGFEVKGNPDLKAAVIKNMDLRWEWYFARKENISFGLFYKEFESPIEEVFLGDSDPVLTFANATRAENTGVEFEFRKYLSFLSRSLNNFSLSGNLSYIDSQIDLSNVTESSLTSDERPLQGQSPYVVNMMLDYDLEKYQSSVSLSYNVFGKRIAQVGTFGLPDIYEQPFHELGLVASKKFDDSYAVKMKLSNLLSEETEFTQGDKTLRTIDKGQAVSLGLSASF